MGETIPPIRPSFNRSVHIEGRPERLTTDAGALLLREADARLGLVRDMAAQLDDRRSVSVHTFPELLRTAIMLPALGWRDQDDADFLRHDAALRVAVSDDRGVTPLTDTGRSPGGLASQPTLSRLHESLSTEHNRTVLRSFLMEGAARRLKAQNGGHRQRYVTLDVDSFPIEVDGHQPGAEYNGHYGGTVFHTAYRHGRRARRHSRYQTQARHCAHRRGWTRLYLGCRQVRAREALPGRRCEI